MSILILINVKYQEEQYQKFKSVLKHEYKQFDIEIQRKDFLLSKKHTDPKVIKLLILICPSEDFFVDSEAEIELLIEYIKNKGRLLITTASSESSNFWKSINYFLSTINSGLEVRCDSVIRANIYELNHPKEVSLTEDCIANRGFIEAFKKLTDRDINTDTLVKSSILRFVYPYGCTLISKRPSFVVLTSSNIAIPTSQAIYSIFSNSSRLKEQPESKIEDNCHCIGLLGSSLFFANEYIDNFDNSVIAIIIIKSIIDYTDFPINTGDARTFEVPAKVQVPNLDYLTELMIPSLFDFDALPARKSDILTKQPLFELDNSILPLVIDTFKDLNVEQHKLSLIKPIFSTGRLPLLPAVYGPMMRLPHKPKILTRVAEESKN